MPVEWAVADMAGLGGETLAPGIRSGCSGRMRQFRGHQLPVSRVVNDARWRIQLAQEFGSAGAAMMRPSRWQASFNCTICSAFVATRTIDPAHLLLASGQRLRWRMTRLTMALLQVFHRVYTYHVRIW